MRASGIGRFDIGLIQPFHQFRRDHAGIADDADIGPNAQPMLAGSISQWMSALPAPANHPGGEGSQAGAEGHDAVRGRDHFLGHGCGNNAEDAKAEPLALDLALAAKGGCRRGADSLGQCEHRRACVGMYTATQQDYRSLCGGQHLHSVLERLGCGHHRPGSAESNPTVPVT